MVRYAFVKVGQALIAIFLAALVVFLGVRALPGDPALVLAGDSPDPEVLEAIRERFGLDQPLYVQFPQYLWNALRGDFGVSSANGQEVSSIIGQALPVTLQVTFLAVLIATFMGISLGVIAAYWKGRWPEWIANAAALVGLSVPNFWLAILAIVYLAGMWSIIPASGYVSFSSDPVEWLRRLIVPGLILGTSFAAVVMRQTRSSMLEVLGTEFVLAARSKGMGEAQVVLRHGLRNSLVVVVTLIGLQIGFLISGAAVVEQIFGLPGIGRAAVTAVFARDYAVVQAVVLVSAVVYVVINLMVDLLYGILDPRIRAGGEK